MNQFTLAGRERTFLFAFMILGALCLGITYLTDDALHTRFWSNFLHNSVFFTGIAFLAIFFLCACIIAFSGWHVVFKRLWEAFSQFLPVGIILMFLVVIGLWLKGQNLYHWSDAESVANDTILQGKKSFLNPLNYTLFTLIILGVWYFFAWKIRSLSIEEDKASRFDYALHKRKIRVWAAIFLPLAGFSSAAVIWLWVMSLDAHWYSTLFAWYCTISWFVSMLCVTILTLIYLKSKGYFEEVTVEHLHDLGKYTFAFSIFWTYLWFSQYMLIWYGNNGEETIYFRQRADEYPVLFYANLLINFVLPFLVLMRNDTKRKMGTLIVVCVIVLFGHWLDYFLMIKPGALHTAHELLGHGHEAGHAVAEAGHDAAAHSAEAIEHVSHFTSGFTLPGFLELGTFLGFWAMFMFFAFKALEKAPLVPKGDPFIDESLHHHVI